MRIIALLLALVAFASPAHAQFGGSQNERRYTVTEFDKVRVDGGFAVTLTTGRSPFATAKGSPAALDNLSVSVNGKTLVIRRTSSAWGGYPGEDSGAVSIEIGTYDVRQAYVNGAGALDIDAIDGFEFGVSVQGSGAVRIGQLDVDRFDLMLNGAASAQIAGSAEDGTIVLRGVSALRGSDLDVRDLTLGIDGPGYAELGTSRAVKLDMVGPGEVRFAGQPACTVTTAGSPTILGCRP